MGRGKRAAPPARPRDRGQQGPGHPGVTTHHPARTRPGGAEGWGETPVGRDGRTPSRAAGGSAAGRSGRSSPPPSNGRCRGCRRRSPPHGHRPGGRGDARGRPAGLRRPRPARRGRAPHGRAEERPARRPAQPSPVQGPVGGRACRAAAAPRPRRRRPGPPVRDGPMRVGPPAPLGTTGRAAPGGNSRCSVPDRRVVPAVAPPVVGRVCPVAVGPSSWANAHPSSDCGSWGRRGGGGDEPVVQPLGVLPGQAGVPRWPYPSSAPASRPACRMR